MLWDVTEPFSTEIPSVRRQKNRGHNLQPHSSFGTFAVGFRGAMLTGTTCVQDRNLTSNG